MITYPGLPGPEISDHLTRAASRAHYQAGTEFHIARISMIANTGTYLDTPFHRLGDGPDLSGVALSSLADLEGIVVRATDVARAIERERLLPFEVRGRAVLLHTGWDRHWRTPAYGEGAPFLSKFAALWLAGQKVALVGIDSLNIDDTESGGERPAHSGLLAAGIHVVEHLTNLDALPASGARFTAAPPAVEGFGTFPVRAFAIVP